MATFSVFFTAPCLNPCKTTLQSCSATMNGDRIDLTSSLEITGDDGPQNNGTRDCPTSCQVRSASCNIDVGDAGSYLVVFGGGRREETAFPPPTTLRLFGDGGCGQQ